MPAEKEAQRLGIAEADLPRPTGEQRRLVTAQQKWCAVRHAGGQFALLRPIPGQGLSEHRPRFQVMHFAQSERPQRDIGGSGCQAPAHLLHQKQIG